MHPRKGHRSMMLGGGSGFIWDFAVNMCQGLNTLRFCQRKQRSKRSVAWMKTGVDGCQWRIGV